jgi:hypothetical protein
MAETYKVLAQVSPAATILTDAYTVPASTSTVISSITVANRSSSASRYRISIAVGGAADAVQQYIAFDVSLANRSTDSFVIGITLAAGDVIRVRTDDGNCSFNVFGAQVT